MGAVSHDLRTPLATIKVASSTLSNRSVSLSADQLAELYNLIEVESDRLTRLVSNLLDITRIEAGVFTVHPSPTSVQELVREAVNAMEPTLGTHRGRLDRAHGAAGGECRPTLDRSGVDQSARQRQSTLAR